MDLLATGEEMQREASAHQAGSEDGNGHGN
jgi:hypothetical protein